jgi:5-methyltetrahydropteroyltriglutamate--homocysteine methyltransferase
VTRIRTTHTGSLPRPDALVESILAREAGRPAPDLEAQAAVAVADVVRRQIETGLDIVNDGEMPRAAFARYVKDRLGGFVADGESPAYHYTDLAEHPDYAERVPRLVSGRGSATCRAALTPGDPAALRREIDQLQTAAAEVGAAELFMTAPSPGIISIVFGDRHYGSRETYLHAIGEAMRPDYEAIVAAGITLQLDCPDLAMGRHARFGDLTDEAFRREAMLAVEALNEATRSIPPERMRIHLCWGNYEGPHHRDIGLAGIIDIALRARPAGISLEACNPRHGHEWAVFEDVRLPDGKYLIPGVIDSTTNYVEHPELVAQRIATYVRLVGAERVVAGTDCGFGTAVSRDWQVVPSVVWAKLASLVEGARLASASA